MNLTVENGVVDKYLSLITSVEEITEEMKVGRRPPGFELPAAGAKGVDAKADVVFVHGYCVESNPWADQKEDWTDCEGYYFEDDDNPNNLSIEEFAEMVYDFT